MKKGSNESKFKTLALHIQAGPRSTNEKTGMLISLNLKFECCWRRRHHHDGGCITLDVGRKHPIKNDSTQWYVSNTRFEFEFQIFFRKLARAEYRARLE